MAGSKNAISKEEIQKRLILHDNAREIDRLKRSGGMDGPFPRAAGQDAPVESLTSFGKSSEELYGALKKELAEFLVKLGDYAFSDGQRERYFAGNKMKNLLSFMKSAGLELESRYVMDLFKDRVKQRNGGKMPMAREKKGLLGKAVERPMKPEEIALSHDIEVDAPPNPDNPTQSPAGTQRGLLRHMTEMLLLNEEILDPFKKAPRKTLARFLQAAGLFNPSPSDPNEKYYAASLLTPQAIQPCSVNDKEKMEKYMRLLKMGTKWLESKTGASAKKPDGAGN